MKNSTYWHTILPPPLPILVTQPDDGAPHLPNTAPKLVTKQPSKGARFVIRPLQTLKFPIIVRVIDRRVWCIGFCPAYFNDIARPNLVFSKLDIRIRNFFPYATPQTRI